MFSNIHQLGNRFLSLHQLQGLCCRSTPLGRRAAQSYLRVSPHHLPPPPFVSSGCKNTQHGQTLKELMQTPNFRVTVVQEADTVEICGALKVGEPLTGVCGSWLAKSAVL